MALEGLDAPAPRSSHNDRPSPGSRVMCAEASQSTRSPLKVSDAFPPVRAKAQAGLTAGAWLVVQKAPAGEEKAMGGDEQVRTPTRARAQSVQHAQLRRLCMWKEGGIACARSSHGACAFLRVCACAHAQIDGRPALQLLPAEDGKASCHTFGRCACPRVDACVCIHILCIYVRVYHVYIYSVMLHLWLVCMPTRGCVCVCVCVCAYRYITENGPLCVSTTCTGMHAQMYVCLHACFYALASIY